jgi:molybdopterin molybdotransferase
VIANVGAGLRERAVETVPLLDALGRVLAEDIAADRDYPPLDKSVRDGFAVRAEDVPGTLRILGEVRAGEHYSGAVGRGEAVEIMTGAPLPSGADAVVMVEHTTRADGHVTTDRSATPGENYNPAGIEARRGELLVGRGARLGFAEMAMAATTGHAAIRVYQRPRVAILTTGDEITPIEETPAPWQIRNSNLFSLAAQVTRAGGIPVPLPVARDAYEPTVALLERALEADLLLLSGGVSAGRYDVVEKALAGLGAEFFFDRVRIQPGQPLVFGRVRGRFFFGLPGNPASTMVTFEIFARAALDLISGRNETPLPLLLARLEVPFRQKPGLTRFLPARLSPDGAGIRPVAWHGSGDIPSLVRANCFLVTEPDREQWSEGDLIRVLLK